MTYPHKIYIRAMSTADALGYRGQKLLRTRPNATTTVSWADTWSACCCMFTPPQTSVLDQNFTQEGGNLFYKEIAPGQRVQINLLASRTGSKPGIQAELVEGVGYIDTLTELQYIFNYQPLIVDIEAELDNGEILSYQTRVPNLEEALVLKAFAWRERGKEKDLADVHTLLEIREAHSETPWRLNAPNPIGFRKDTVEILQPLASVLTKKRAPFPVPNSVGKRRLAALISKHCLPR